MLAALCIAVPLSPVILFVIFMLRDRFVEKHDQQILDKCRRLEELFVEARIPHKKLTRVYLESSSGSAYPFDVFMIEYSGGAHPVDTIWLPVRHFLNASDDEIRDVLANELTQPGRYTIIDWEEAAYNYILLQRQNPYQRRSPMWKKWLKALRV